MLESSTLHVL